MGPTVLLLFMSNIGWTFKCVRGSLGSKGSVNTLEGPTYV